MSEKKNQNTEPPSPSIPTKNLIIDFKQQVHSNSNIYDIVYCILCYGIGIMGTHKKKKKQLT